MRILFFFFFFTKPYWFLHVNSCQTHCLVLCSHCIDVCFTVYNVSSEQQGQASVINKLTLIFFHLNQILWRNDGEFNINHKCSINDRSFYSKYLYKVAICQQKYKPLKQSNYNLLFFWGTWSELCLKGVHFLLNSVQYIEHWSSIVIS